MRLRHNVICGLPGFTIYFHLISQTARFSKTKVIEQKMCVVMFYAKLSKHFSFLEDMSETRSQMYIGRHVKYRYYCQILIKLEFCPQISKNGHISYFFKSVQMDPHCSMRTDVHTDRYDDTNTSRFP
jgi:hypothetical protein